MTTLAAAITVDASIGIARHGYEKTILAFTEPVIAFGLNRGARVRGRPKRLLVTIGRTTQAPYLPGETVPLGEGRRPASCCACGVRRRDFDADASATCGTAGSVHVPARGAVLAQRWKESLPAISLLSPVPKPSTH